MLYVAHLLQSTLTVSGIILAQNYSKHTANLATLTSVVLKTAASNPSLCDISSLIIPDIQLGFSLLKSCVILCCRSCLQGRLFQ